MVKWKSSFVFAAIALAAAGDWGNCRVLAAAGAETIQFNRDIRPIFADTCFKCHGFDKASRKGDLRLDIPEEAFKPHKKGTPIVAGHPELSEAYTRLMSSDPDLAMPPLDSKLSLTAPQKELVRRWIAEGAVYQRHWAFIPVSRPAIPAVKLQEWAKNPVDAFVLAKLEAEGLMPSAPADRATLLRRVTLDLTGLPPTLAELNAFLADQTPDAYRVVVERLLASPRYGERMAGDWLDLARFADTEGYQVDRYRPMWPYRDWVIDAFNENMPFDQFGTWQLAGDLLPHPTKEQRLATAFNRLHMQNAEGGIVGEEFRCAYVMDRVDTFGTTFLGLTVGCAHCHDHKFDPITQRDFYSMFALFQNVDESGQIPDDGTMPVPTLLLSSDSQDARLESLRTQIAAREKQIRSLAAASSDGFAAWLASKGPVPSAPAGMIGDFEFEQIQSGDRIANAADPAKPGFAVEHPRVVAGKTGKAAALSGDNGFRFPGITHFSRIDPFSLSLWLQTRSNDSPRMTVLHDSFGFDDYASRGYDLLVENGHVALGLYHTWPGNSLKVRTKMPIPAGRWVHVVATYDGSSRAAGVRIYVDGAAAETEVVRDSLTKDFLGIPDLVIGYRNRDSGFRDGLVDEFRIFNRAVTPLEAAELAGGDDLTIAWKMGPRALTETQREGLLEYYLSSVAPEAGALAQQLHELRRQQRDLIEPIPEIMVMQELPTPKKAYILKRGQYDSHGDEVFGDVPTFLGGLPPDQPHNRLGLARWLFAPGNPLAARVEVNRLWQQMFGKGIVETSENFGSQGSYPTNPELLDWLSAEFVDNGWNLKQLLRLIALSATYQQSSRVNQDMLERDPDDRLLARGPARRLTAEMIRDQALEDSGLLVEKIGGPSMRPYQPAGLWDVAMAERNYNQGHGDELHRRSLYTFWKRTIPPPAMSAFDAADRSYCTARRQSTSTPLQALALLDDVQITEAAKLIGQRMIKEGGSTPDTRITFVFRLMTAHDPTPAEMDVLRRLFTEQRALFAADPSSATKLLNEGEAKVDPWLNQLDLAADTVLAQALFNFDDTMMRR